MCLRVIRDHRYYGSIVSLEITIMNPNIEFKIEFEVKLKVESEFKIEF